MSCQWDETFKNIYIQRLFSNKKEKLYFQYTFDNILKMTFCIIILPWDIVYTILWEAIDINFFQTLVL